MSFFEVEFPRTIGFGAVGGPSWNTIVNQGLSGFEQRNKNWLFTRQKYQLDLVAQPLSIYKAVRNFYLNVSGRADAFRLFDPTDYLVTAQATSPSTGNGANKIFQLQKTYTIGGRTYTRTVSKPIMAGVTDSQGNALTNTVVMYLNGVKKTLGTDYTVDYTTGLVTFIVAPGNGVAVTADAQFHMPVRFDSDDWPAQIMPSDVADGNALVTVTGINLIEVLIVAGQSQG